MPPLTLTLHRNIQFRLLLTFQRTRTILEISLWVEEERLSWKEKLTMVSPPW